MKPNKLKKSEEPTSAASKRRRSNDAEGGMFANMNEDKRTRVRKTAGAFLLLFSLFLFVSIISHIIYSGSSDQSVLTGQEPGVSNKGGWFGAYFSQLLVTSGFGYISILLPLYFGLIGFALFENKYWHSVRKWLLPVSFTVYWVSTTMAFFTLVFGISAQDLGGGIGLLLAEVLSTYIGLVGLGFLLLFSMATLIIFKYNEKWSFLAFARPFMSKLKKWIGEDEKPLPTQQHSTQEAPETNAQEECDEDFEEDVFIISRKKMEPLEGTTAPADETTPVVKRKVEKKPEFLKPAHLAQDEFELTIDPETIKKFKEEKAEATSSDDIDFQIEAPLGLDTQAQSPGTASAPDVGYSSNSQGLSIPADGDNIHEVGADRYEKIIPDADQASLPDDQILAEANYDPKKELPSYRYPPLELLEMRGNPEGIEIDREELEANKNRIIKTLSNYSIDITSIKATIGPTVTLYEIVPAPGIRISKIKNLEDDIALSLAAMGIRIIAPMPGKGTIGIEIPNSKPEIVSFRSLLATEKFKDSDADLPIAIGKTISNEVYIADLAKMPHLLVAGATGQGKSVGLNCVIASLLYKKHPSQIKFVLIDPKKVEMTLYQMLQRHFLAKLPNYEESIITDNKQVIHVLNSLCVEMDNRYGLLQDARVRNIKEYNDKFKTRKLNEHEGHRFLPYIVLIIDELADLMMTAGKEIETPIARLAQLARAVGIHLVVATQRPSVNVITGTIKANFPARMSYRVISKVDSRTILDSNGADQLIGRGDVLYFTGSELIRLQNAFIDTDEVDKLVKYISDQVGYSSAYLLPEFVNDDEDGAVGDFDPSERDSLFNDAARLVIQADKGSTSLLQRRFNIGYNRAGRIMDQLERAAIVGPGIGSKPRDVLIHSEAELDHYLKSFA